MSSRALRVGVLLRGNLVEERLFVGAGPITLGQSLRCTLSVPVEGVPREHVLFVRDQGQTVLRLAPGMDARIAHGDTIREVRGDVPIERGGRGKLTIGDATILFQDVAPPPLVPRPQLPASIRGTLGDRIDRRLAVIVGTSLAAHLAIATWAWLADRELDEGAPPVATLRPYQHDILDVTIPDESPVAEPTPGPGVAAPVAPKQTPRPVVPRVSPTGPTMSEDDARRYATIVTGENETPRGAGSMRDRAPVTDLGRMIRDIVDEGRRVEVGSPSRTRPDGTRLGTTHGPDIHGPDQLAQQGPRDEAIGGRIIPTLDPSPEPPVPGQTLTASMVLQKIKSAYLPGLQRCYKKGLLDDGALSGKVKISFTVDEQGRLVDAVAGGVAASVDGCIQSFMGSWRFPFPRDADGDPTRASFAVSLQLRPS